MPDPFVREIGIVTDIDDRPLTVGVDYDTVSIAGYRLATSAIVEFATLLADATWQAGASLMRPEYPHEDEADDLAARYGGKPDA
jgi:hypothetical protein